MRQTESAQGSPAGEEEIFFYKLLQSEKAFVETLPANPLDSRVIWFKPCFNLDLFRLGERFTPHFEKAAVACLQSCTDKRTDKSLSCGANLA